MVPTIRRALQRAVGFHVTAHGKNHAIAIDQFARGARKNRAIRIAIESYAQSRVRLDHFFLHHFGMQRTAACIDIAAIGAIVHVQHIRAKRAK